MQVITGDQTCKTIQETLHQNSISFKFNILSLFRPNDREVAMAANNFVILHENGKSAAFQSDQNGSVNIF